MPEIVEVQVQVDGLQNIVGEIIEKIKIQDGGEVIAKNDDNFIEILEGSMIEKVFRIGKYIVFELSKVQNQSNKRDFFYMLVHLGMTGGFLINKLHPHERIIFQLKKVNLYYWDIRKYGSILILDADQLKRYINLRKLGIDALNASKYEIELSLIQEIYKPKNLKKHIKVLLLDQSIISGLGNIYANEVLFRSKIHPLSTPEDISWDDVKYLAAQISKVVNEAYKLGGSSIKDYANVYGEKGSFQKHHYVYGRKGKPCKNCNTKIERVQIEGRSTFYCPTCQG